MYYVMRASAPSLHRESTDSLIQVAMEIIDYPQTHKVSMATVRASLNTQSIIHLYIQVAMETQIHHGKTKFPWQQ